MPEVLSIVSEEKKSHYLDDFGYAAAEDAPPRLREIRETALTQFAEMPLPHSKQEAWRFTDVRRVLNTAFRCRSAAGAGCPASEAVAPFLYHEAGWTELVFVDGFFSDTLSTLGADTQQVRVRNLAAAFRGNAAEWSSHLDRYAPKTSIFPALNSAFLRDGAYISIGANAVLPDPIHVVHVSTGSDIPTAHYPRNLIVAEPRSEAVIIESYVHLDRDACYLNNAVTEIAIGPDARVHHYKVLEEGPAGYHFGSVMARLDRGASLDSRVLALQGEILRNELSVLFAGEGGACSLDGLYLNDGNRLIDNAIHVDHAMPRCRSRIGYKGVLDGKSKSVFTGKVNVRKGAQRTDSDQLNRNLLLSDDAAINTKPQLEILADDVKCTHGATIGQQPDEVVFYFRSRGMDEATARGMLTYGFAGEVIEALEVDALRKRYARHVYDRYSPE